jgi:hypothetical protein
MAGVAILSYQHWWIAVLLLSLESGKYNTSLLPVTSGSSLATNGVRLL